MDELKKDSRLTSGKGEQDTPTGWFTANGVHIPIYDNETEEHALQKLSKKELHKNYPDAEILPPQEYKVLTTTLDTLYGNKLPKFGYVQIGNYSYNFYLKDGRILCKMKTPITGQNRKNYKWEE